MKKLMTTTLATATALALMAGPALAQNQAALCKLWFAHKAGVKGATYQPGVDVHGNPVVPADVNAAPVVVPDTIRIPITVDLAQQLGAAVPATTEMNAAIGTVTIGQDGTVTYNGQDITPQTYTLCTGQPMPESAMPAKQDISDTPAALPSPVEPPITAVQPDEHVPRPPSATEAELNKIEGAVHTPAPAETVKEEDIFWGEGK